jgi:succinate dehydrogenase / fumarate reductase membrane anchor subunit
MNEKRTSGGFYAWLLQRITGVVLAVLLIAHFIVTHGLPHPSGVTYARIAPRLATPTWKVIDMLFLACALYHGLNGVWMVLQDYVDSEGMQTFLFGVLCVLGAILFFLGAITVIPFAVQA